MPSGLYLPRYLMEERRRANERNKPVSVVFYYNPRTNHLLIGADERTPMHPILKERGYEMVVCRDAHSVDLWSERLRHQEAREQEIERERQALAEGPTREALRRAIMDAKAHAPNQFSRDAAQYYLEKSEREEREEAKHRRISYQHCEAKEDGK